MVQQRATVEVGVHWAEGARANVRGTGGLDQTHVFGPAKTRGRRSAGRSAVS